MQDLLAGPPALSFVIPAHNEEALIGQTLSSLLASARTIGEPFEVIVVDDASADRTAEIARSFGAAVVSVNRRNISAVRNAGARVARGATLIFVDADTLTPVETLASALRAIRQGAVGGGARVRMDNDVPKWAVALTNLVSWSLCKLGLAAGCFLFARREAFNAVGGFDEQYYASEEIHLSRALKSKGRFVIIPQSVITSGRKARMFSARQILKQLVILASGGRSALKRRENLGFWYDGQREAANCGSSQEGGGD
jgi:glycosyltransferase involved in cell wall biosynthesis